MIETPKTDLKPAAKIPSQTNGLTKAEKNLWKSIPKYKKQRYKFL